MRQIKWCICPLPTCIFRRDNGLYPDSARSLLVSVYLYWPPPCCLSHQ